MKVVSLCYDGGGWTFPYLAGITKTVVNHPKLKRNVNFKFAGSSSGACVALAAALDVPMDLLFKESIKYINLVRFFPMLTVLAVKQLALKFLKDRPDVLRQLEEPKLAINVTKMQYGVIPRKHIIYKFNNKTHIVKTAMNTCAVPLINSFALFRRSYDGALTSRFFTLPWKSDLVIKLSSCKVRRDADFCLQAKHIPLYRTIIPYNHQGMEFLFKQGETDGKAVVAWIIDKLEI